MAHSLHEGELYNMKGLIEYALDSYQELAKSLEVDLTTAKRLSPTPFATHSARSNPSPLRYHKEVIGELTVYALRPGDGIGVAVPGRNARQGIASCNVMPTLSTTGVLPEPMTDVHTSAYLPLVAYESNRATYQQDGRLFAGSLALLAPAIGSGPPVVCGLLGQAPHLMGDIMQGRVTSLEPEARYTTGHYDEPGLATVHGERFGDPRAIVGSSLLQVCALISIPPETAAVGLEMLEALGAAMPLPSEM